MTLMLLACTISDSKLTNVHQQKSNMLIDYTPTKSGAQVQMDYGRHVLLRLKVFKNPKYSRQTELFRHSI